MARLRSDAAEEHDRLAKVYRINELSRLQVRLTAPKWHTNEAGEYVPDHERTARERAEWERLEPEFKELFDFFGNVVPLTPEDVEFAKEVID